MSIWEAIDKVFAETHYLQPVMIITEIIFILTAASKSINNKHYIIIIIMTILFVIENIYYVICKTYYYLNIQSSFFRKNYNAILVSTFLYFQYYAITNFQYTVACNKKFEKIAKRLRIPLILVAFLIVLAALIYHERYPFEFSIMKLFWAIVDLLLIPGSVIFFNKLIHQKSKFNILALPEFWMNVGIISFSIGSFPLHLSASFTQFQALSFITNDLQIVLYTLMFILFIKALVCLKYQEN